MEAETVKVETVARRTSKRVATRNVGRVAESNLTVWNVERVSEPAAGIFRRTSRRRADWEAKRVAVSEVAAREVEEEPVKWTSNIISARDAEWVALPDMTAQDSEQVCNPVA